MKKAMRLFATLIVIAAGGCSAVPRNFYSTPKNIEIDGRSYTACSGTVWVYSPSREVAASTEKSYEIMFSDNYGRDQDFKDVTSYTISDDEHAMYAMPDVLPGPDDTKYSNGTPFKPGDVVWFGKHGDGGRAIWISPGKWKPVPCHQN